MWQMKRNVAWFPDNYKQLTINFVRCGDIEWSKTITKQCPRSSAASWTLLGYTGCNC